MTGQLKGDAMVRHIDNELQELKDLILQMGGFVEKALDSATAAILKFSPSDLETVQKFEEKINDLLIRVDEACVNVLAKQAPVARDLRLVIAIVKINTDLERMGDQAVNIGLVASDFPHGSRNANCRTMISGGRTVGLHPMVTA